MIRFIFVFAALAVLIHLGITYWQKMSGSQRWSLAKTAIYSAAVSLLAVSLMIAFVMIF